MAIYEDTKGNTFSTQAEAAASNTALGTNPSTGGSLNIPKIADPIKQAPVIPLTTAIGGVKPSKLPPTPVSTATTDLSSTAGGFIAMPAINSLNQIGTANTIAQSNAQKATADFQTNTEALINQMQNRPGQLEQQYGIQALSADALKSKANYDSVELAYRRQKEATVTNPALSADAKQSRLAEIDRKEASQKADIAIDYNLKAGLLSNAKELMQKQIALELEPMKLKVDFYKTIKEDYANILNNTQKAQLDRLEKQEDRAYQSAKEANNRKYNLIEKAMDNGIYSADMKDMSYDQLAEKIALSNATSGDFASTLDTAVSFEPATLQKSTKQELANLVANGDYKGALTRVTNAVSKGLTGENKTNFDAKRNALPAIDTLNAKLQAYANAGGDMGILKGKVEDIAAKLGQVNDPNYKALATDLKIALQAYRQSVSGAAFSPQEAKEYASVNPTGNKSLNLNTAILEGMKNNFERQVNSTVESMVGDGVKYMKEYASYQGLPKEDALVKYYKENPDKQQVIDELRSVPGVTIEDIANAVGITKLIK